MPSTETGKTIASRNATTHGLFARDVVLPRLGEDPEGYRAIEAEWMAQLPPRTLLERHYVEKIAAASWRLRRLHRWQAQIFEDDTLTEAERLDRLDKVLRHETALHRQIDTAVKMLAKDAPQLFARRVRDQVLEETQISEREYREDIQDEMGVDLATRSRLYQIRKATERSLETLSQAPLDAAAPASPENCQNELPNELPPADTDTPAGTPAEAMPDVSEPRALENCQNEPVPFYRDPRRVSEYLDPAQCLRVASLPPLPGKGRRVRRV